MRHVYEISGMTCNGCRSHVENALKKIPAVKNVVVDLEKSEAVIEMERHIELSELRSALKDAGGNYDISDKHNKEQHAKKEAHHEMTHTYHVEGMTCNG